MSKAFSTALRLLARREHSADELSVKLINKGYNLQESIAALKECQRLGLQSDERFASSLHRRRAEQGYGPIRIKQELQFKRIDQALITKVMELESTEWVRYALVVWQKKYKKQDKPTANDLQKQQQFLRYRGFPSDVISSVFQEIEV